MQGRERDYDYAARSEIQAARLLNGNAKKGGNWKAGKVYQISVLNFHYKRGDKSEMSWYTMRDEEGCPLADRLNVIYIDLLTIKRLVGAPVESLTPLQKWGLYFSYADDESKADYIARLGASERGIMEATTIIQKMSEEDAAFFREFSRDKAMRDYNEGMENAMERGLKKGLERGLAEGAQQKAVETAKRLLADGKYTAEEISGLLGIPVEAFAEPAQA